MSENDQNKDEKTEGTGNEATEDTKVQSRKPSSKTSKDRNVVYVGNKPPMNYVMAVITAFNMGDGDQVTLKARGRAISTAVDVAEITRNRFFRETKVNAISIGTEEITPREGGNPRNVSTMEISLTK
jgi:DNA-binding protein